MILGFILLTFHVLKAALLMSKLLNDFCNPAEGGQKEYSLEKHYYELRLTARSKTAQMFPNSKKHLVWV